MANAEQCYHTGVHRRKLADSCAATREGTAQCLRLCQHQHDREADHLNLAQVEVRREIAMAFGLANDTSIGMVKSYEDR